MKNILSPMSLPAFQIIQRIMKLLSMKIFNVLMTTQRFFIEIFPAEKQNKNQTTCFSTQPDRRQEENKYEKNSLVWSEVLTTEDTLQRTGTLWDAFLL